MAATPVLLLITRSSDNSSPPASFFHITMLSSCTFFIFLTFLVLIFTLYAILKNNNHGGGCKKEENSVKIQSLPVNDDEKIAQQEKQETGCGADPENLARSLLLEILPSSSPKWDELFSKSEDFDDDPGVKSGSGQEEKKRKKKRARKKRPDPNEEERKEKEELVCLYPFTKSSSATQRKIKQQYDQLVKSHGSNGLTLDQVILPFHELLEWLFSNMFALLNSKRARRWLLDATNVLELGPLDLCLSFDMCLSVFSCDAMWGCLMYVIVLEGMKVMVFWLKLWILIVYKCTSQVGQFVNCLVEARNELQNKSEVIKRRFTITKALLFKADRSSFDRLRQQIYKLELEQKRLEEDAFVYNWLQEQLKVSPAYKKMLEIGACMEMKAKSSDLVESTDADFSDISFEELLAQEKKDAFWQRNGKLKPCSG
ncbi:hypothetical protein Sango_1666900 [Sesamum angolense]|uniref:CA-responsive protein n=1 Tax=Sesamum angolense TaxID=2727404 RepID=A0AAE1WKP7_9LAMI|nr:hypothetical protein Sango_1666900 [Sesamum angolense]